MSYTKLAMEIPRTTNTLVFKIFSKGFLLGVVGLSLFYYFLLLAITKDPQHPINQFWEFQPWMSLLIIGFGTQLGLYWLMRNGVQFKFSLQDKSDARAAAGTGTVASGMAMVACCAHHAVVLLPILGLSAAALFLSEYQEQLLIFGVVANLVGISMMTWFIVGRASPQVIAQVIMARTRSVS